MWASPFKHNIRQSRDWRSTESDSFHQDTVKLSWFLITTISQEPFTLLSKEVECMVLLQGSCDYAVADPGGGGGGSRSPLNWLKFSKISWGQAPKTPGAPPPFFRSTTATKGYSAVCSDLNHNLKNISPCDHEEAGTRMLLYVRREVI